MRHPRTHPLTAIMACLSMLSPAWMEARDDLTIQRVRASSELRLEEGGWARAAFADDRRLSTWWAEGEQSAGLGDWIEFSFPNERPLRRVIIHAGNWADHEAFLRNNRLKKIQLRFSDRSTKTVELPDKMEPVVVDLNPPVRTRSVRIVLKAVYPGTTFNNSGISQVRFIEEGPPPSAEDFQARASSRLKADASRTYDASNLLDGLVDTMWCEGKDGPGIGETITFTRTSDAPLTMLSLLNGVAVSESTYQRNNRVKRLRVEAGEYAREFDVKDRFGKVQHVLLPALTARRIKIRILAAYPGTEFDDTCISEIEWISSDASATMKVGGEKRQGGS